MCTPEKDDSNNANSLPRIVSVTSSLRINHGGAFRAIVGISKLLEKNYNHLLVVLGEREYGDLNLFQRTSIFNNNYGVIWNFSGHLRKSIKEADLLICHGFYLFSTLLVMRYANSPVFIIPHGSLDDIQQKKRRLLKKLFMKTFWRLAREVNVVLVATSEIEKVQLERSVKNLKVILLPLGNALPIIDISAKADHSSGEVVRLISISRIAHKKRIDIMIRALYELRSRGYDAILTVCGAGNKYLLNNLKSLISKLDLGQSVIFTGWVDDADRSQFLKEHHIFLLPSLSENYAYSVAEAIWFGTPVIVSRNVGLADEVERFSLGQILKNLDVSELADEIEVVLKNLQVYSSNCLHFRHELSWEHKQDYWFKRIDETIQSDIL